MRAAAPPPPLVRPLERAGIAIVVILNAAYYCAAARQVTAPGFPLDDSWIHLQFARHLASGYGFSFNPGISSSGSTAPLWTFMLVVPTLLHVNIMAAAKVLGTALTIVTAIAAADLVGLLTLSRVGAVVAGLAVALSPRLAWASVSGMEVSLYCALTAVALLQYVKALRTPRASGVAWAGTMFGTVRSGGRPVFAHSLNQRGRMSASGSIFAIVLKSSCSGICGLPQSRPCENDQSSVAIRPTAPAAFARCTRARMSSREPAQ